MQASHEHRVIGNRLCQKLFVGIAVGPGALIPTPPDDPLACRYIFCAFDNKRDCSFLGGHIDEIDLVKLSTQTEDMGM